MRRNEGFCYYSASLFLVLSTPVSTPYQMHFNRGRVKGVDPVPLPQPGEKVIAGIKSTFAYVQFRDWALAAGFLQRDIPDVAGFVQRLRENTRVPGIGVKHTRAGNFLVGLTIRTEDRKPNETDLDELDAVQMST